MSNYTYSTIPQDDEQADIQKNKVMAVLAYFGILFLIPLLAAKESKYARFHTNQGLVLWLCNLVISFVVGFISGLFAAVEVLALVLSLVSTVISIVFFVLMIIGIVNAAKGQAKPLPIIGGITLLK